MRLIEESLSGCSKKMSVELTNDGKQKTKTSRGYEMSKKTGEGGTGEMSELV